MLRQLYTLLALLALSSCSYKARIDSAYATHQLDGRVLISVKADMNELNRMMQKQYYFSIVVAECSTKAEIYPARPYIDGIPASRFPQSKNGIITGTLPRRIFETTRKPCAYLRGGSYFFEKVESNLVPIRLR